jgi:CubicO group peptidase (beta-lactamase class C family)
MKRLIFICIMLPATVQSQSYEAVTTSIDSLFSSWFKTGEPGGAVLIAKDGHVVYQKGFGIADINTREPVTPKTLFNIGSISKTFVAYGILKLADQGRLSLDDNLQKYFPDFKNPSIANKVKIVHLLTHTSGLPDSRKVSEQHEFYLTAKDEENFAPLKSTEKLEFEPGTRYRYSNPAFNGLALIIEKVTGKKWQDYIKANIFSPAKMQMSTITDGAHPEQGVSHGYIVSEKKEFEELDYGEEPTFAAAGNGGVWSSVEELWRYEKSIQSHQFLNEKRIDSSRRPYPFAKWSDTVGQRLGLSWFITNEHGQKMIGHTGSQGGFISDYLWLPEKKIFYVLLCNTPKPITEVRSALFSLLEKKQWLQ